MLLLSLLVAAGVARSQFNTTFQFVLKPLSPSLDIASPGDVWAYDDKTGYAYLGSEGYSSGNWFASFIAKTFRLYGVADNNLHSEGYLVMRPSIANGGPTLTINSSTETRLLAEWTAPEPMIMNLNVFHGPAMAITIHNITIDVPVRTQA